jgi:hypothetical protein
MKTFRILFILASVLVALVLLSSCESTSEKKANHFAMCASTHEVCVSPTHIKAAYQIQRPACEHYPAEINRTVVDPEFAAINHLEECGRTAYYSVYDERGNVSASKLHVECVHMAIEADVNKLPNSMQVLHAKLYAENIQY